MWDRNVRSVDYAASLAADAQQRAARFERAATAQAPYASDAGMLTRMGSTSSTSSMGQFHLPGQQAPLPASKVTSTVISSDAYAAALQESALARQRSRQVLASPAPFAVQPGEGGAAAAPSPEVFRLRKAERADPPAKVGERSPEASLRKQAHLSPKASPGQQPSGSRGRELCCVTDSQWDQQRTEEEGRQRQAVQEATRRRNWGTPGLLG
ncbi:hypothetical protein ABPG77_007969 [Micractinium sp. CCAP 211/92]